MKTRIGKPRRRTRLRFLIAAELNARDMTRADQAAHLGMNAAAFKSVLMRCRAWERATGQKVTP